MDAYGFSMTFDSAEATIQQCAGCHSRREAFGNGNPLPGTLYHDAYGLALLRPGLYHPDGQISDEVYVYGSFLQSKMYARGVGCTNCHDAHSTELKAEGNGVCAQCHSPAGNPAFPTLRPKVYDGPEHTFHAAGSPGAQCKSCHMIERVYMGIDGRRDHSFRIPRPDLAAQTGGPDACTDCHSDKRADWAAARIAEWYPDSMHRGPHYGQTLAQGMHDPSAVLGPLGDLAADTEQAGIVRATALWLLEQSGDAASADRAEPLLQDPDPLVRNAAADLQRAASPQNRVSRLVALLHDPVRAVRMTAARQFLDAPIAHMPPTMSEDLQAAMTEWRASLNNQLDFPEIQMRLGGMGLTLRNIRLATAGFREAVVLDAQLTAAWMMLARIAAATEGPQAAQSVLEEALTRNPDDLGLIQSLSELGAPAGKLTP